MLDPIVPLNTSSFFAFAFPLHAVKKKQIARQHRLPRLDDWQGREGFADLYLGWHDEGIAIKIAFPSKSLVDDSVFELMLDTRDLKSATSPHRFCHHFLMRRGEEAIEAFEITKFRHDDARPLCNPELLDVKVKGKELIVWIPKEALTGYESTSFKRIGLAYRLTRAGGEPQDLPLSSEDIAIEKHPARWASCELMET